FSQDPMTGLLTLGLIVVIQFLEGNFLQPLIMSRATKLHPVTIMLGLLIFGYFWGIIGMIVATPIIASVKAIFMFYNEKYNIIHLN
ncbi:MAG: AI-2E family transporter, partial [Bacilli bacterium]|nr:AI-2E family transporter [Bacilli bacterium]